MSIGSRLKEWRKENNLKTTDIRDNTGISIGALSNYENDKRDISSQFLLKIKEVYNADIYYILTGVKSNELTTNEKELIDNFRYLPEREQIKFIGRLEELVDKYKNPPTKSSNSEAG